MKDWYFEVGHLHLYLVSRTYFGLRLFALYVTVIANNINHIHFLHPYIRWSWYVSEPRMIPFCFL